MKKLLLTLLLLCSFDSLLAKTNPDMSSLNDSKGELSKESYNNAFLPFITTWNTAALSSGSSNSTSITIPTEGIGYNYDVDWNNDGTYDEFGVTGSLTHDYGTAGTYSVAIRGTFPRIYFSNSGDKLKLVSIDQWGDIVWSSMGRAFFGCQNMVLNATDVPNTAAVTDMSFMFGLCQSFNQALPDGFNTSAVTNMWGMFYFCTAYNQALPNSFNTNNVTSMESMFEYCTSYNQALPNSFNTTNVTNMRSMFSNCSSFNQILPMSFNTGNVTVMEGMFLNCTSFNKSLPESFNTEKVRYMNGMFYGSSAYNQALPQNFNTGEVIEMRDIFTGCNAFNQYVGNLNLSNVTNMVNIFLNSGISQSTYDAILKAWDNAGYTNKNLGDASPLSYCAGQIARNNLITNKGWTITGDVPAACREINVKGNNVSIVNTAATSSTLDSTDFGTITLGQSNTNTFWIINEGTVALTLGANPVSQIGTNQADFTLTQPSPTTIAAGDSVSFQITFDPTTEGLRTDIVSIANDDVDESPFTFAITGTGTTCSITATPTDLLTWTGAKNNVWNEACNWTPVGVPSATNDVVIPSGTLNEPTLFVNNASASTVEVQSGATFTIATGGKLELNGERAILTALSSTFYNKGTVDNKGKIVMGNINAIGSIGVSNHSTFNNISGGEVLVDNTTLIGIFNSRGNFNNEAKITIGANSHSGIFGLTNDESTFNNNPGGEITIDRAENGISNVEGGIISNNAKITIGAISPIQTSGIDNRYTSYFNNNASGIITIDKTGQKGIWNALGSTFTNYGKITIGENASEGVNGIHNGSTFINSQCAELKLIRGDFLNSATYSTSNAGYILVSDSLKNEGTFTNDGILKYGVQTNNPIVNTANSSVIVNDTLSSIFTYGGTFNGTVNGIFKDEAATNLAGTFTAPNGFTPSSTLPLGVQTLYAKISPEGWCSHIVPFFYNFECTIPSITLQPISQIMCPENPVTLEVLANGNELNYQWQVANGTGFTNLIDGSIHQGVTTPSLSLTYPTTDMNTYQYRCIVTGSGTCNLLADTSAIANVSIGVVALGQTVTYTAPISNDDGVTQAVTSVLGTNSILPSGKAEFRAGNEVILNPGFNAQVGAVFTAKIMNSCPSSNAN